MEKSSKSKVEIPMCVCGHDIFGHDMSIMPLQNAIIGVATNKIQAGHSIEVGRCHANDIRHDSCKCKRYNSTDMWMHKLWEEFEQHEDIMGNQ